MVELEVGGVGSTGYEEGSRDGREDEVDDAVGVGVEEDEDEPRR